MPSMSCINFHWEVKYFTEKMLGSPDSFMPSLRRKYLENFQLDWTFKLIAAYNWTLDIHMFVSSFMAETMN